MSNFKKSRTAKVTGAFVGLTASLLMLGGVAVLPALADSSADLQAQIDALLAQVKALQSQLGSSSSSSTAASGFTFNSNLKLGSKGADVMNLQKVLNMSSDTQVASGSGAGAPGHETSTFGPATKAAVIKFQEKYAADILTPVGLTKGTGVVGPSTRAKLNSLSSASPAASNTTTTTTTTTTTASGSPSTPASTAAGALTVSAPASLQPAPALAPYAAARIPFTKVVLTAGANDVTVNTITVERTGLSSDSSFTGVDLVDANGNLVGLEKTLNSDHKAILSGVVVKAGTSQTLTIAATRSASAGSHGGESVGFQVDAIDAGSSSVGGDAFPLKGAIHTINETLTIGSVTSFVNGSSNPSAQSKPVGTTSYIFSSIKFSAGSAEKVWLKSIRWNQSGSAGVSDIANVKTYVDGVAYDTSVSSDGKYYTSNFGNGLLIDKGGSKEIYVQGDIVSGSSRTVEFDIYRNTDLSVYGDTYGYYLVPPSAPNSGGFAATATNPWFTGNAATVQSGTLTVSKSTSVAAQNIAINLPNQPLGGFDVEVKGEPVSVTNMVYNFSAWQGTGASASTQDITDVKLVDATGKVVAGPVDIASSAATVTFTDTVTFPIGKNTYTLKGKIGTDFASNQTITASTTPSGWTATGQNTGNNITPTPSTAVSGNTMTVKAATLTITNSNDPAAQTVVAGGQKFTFANYQLDASQSGEDVKLTTLKGQLTFGTPTSANLLTGCELYDGGTALTTGSNDVNPATADTSPKSYTFTFDSGSYVVPKGTVKTLTVKCNISATATSTYSWGLPVNTSQSTGTGLTSGQTVTPATQAAATGQTMTVTSGGSLTIVKDSSSPSYAIASAGTTGNLLGVFKLHAANEPIQLQKFAMILTNGASSSASDLSQVTLWDAAGNQVGSAVFTGGNTHATSTLTGNFTVPKDSDKLLYVKGDVSSIGVSAVLATSGDLLAVDYDGGDSTGTQGQGMSSGSVVNQGSSSNTAVAGVRIMKTYPTITMLSLPTNTLANGVRSLLRFKVAAAPQGDVGLYKFQLEIATTTATVSTLNAYAYTDSGFSVAASGIGNGGKMLNSDLTMGTVWHSGTTNLNIYPQTTTGASTTLEIPAGQSRYFDVTGNVSGSASGASVSTQIEGDAAYPQLKNAMAAVCCTTANNSVENETGGHNAFIWSPNSTTTAGVPNDEDWTNGYGVSGLTGTNNTPVIVSQ